MKKFMDKDFLLSNDAAIRLYHNYAGKMPVIDYHCHINPAEIAADKRFDNITQIWLGGDHYKWRFMRACGIEERYITGDAPDREKFLKWAQALGKAVGNPLYHWSHLELRRYFHYDGILNEKTAEDVWELCNARLSQPEMSARGIIRSSNVRLICTTDDPADTLEYHRQLADDTTFETKVLPAWRPDRAMNIETAEYSGYLERLESAAGCKISSFTELIDALRLRIDYFASMGCVLSDHGPEYVMYCPAGDDEIESIFQKRLDGAILNDEEICKFKTAFLLAMAREYHKRDWVMQLHFGCLRNNNTAQFKKIGADTGYDAIADSAPAAQLVGFLDELNSEDSLPRTILYSLNPNDNQVIDTVMACFQDSSAVSKMQHGSAWWFNDHKTGMQDQLVSLANLGNLSGFAGMLTDSRSFLSYTRHEYFRRILCNFLGTLVENGEYPDDFETLGKIVEDISYNNAVRYFKFSL